MLFVVATGNCQRESDRTATGPSARCAVAQETATTIEEAPVINGREVERGVGVMADGAAVGLASALRVRALHSERQRLCAARVDK